MSAETRKENFKQISVMTADELKKQLLTCDYRGVAFKTMVLDELLEREYSRGWDAGREVLD